MKIFGEAPLPVSPEAKRLSGAEKVRRLGLPSGAKLGSALSVGLPINLRCNILCPTLQQRESAVKATGKPEWVVVQVFNKTF